MLGQDRNDYGRLVPKPAPPVDENYFEEHLEDGIPIQEQLDALAVKIQLKEFYNHALRDELEESAMGASSILKELQKETKRLRCELIEACNAEKSAVYKALRTHREFQLAMNDRTGVIGIPWLDDKVYDLSRRLNLFIAQFHEKQKKMEEAERIVELIEKWPMPGTMPWEIGAIATFHSYEGRIEDMKVKLETAKLLHAKYAEISNILKEEKGKFIPIMATVLDHSKLLSSELADLQKTLRDAVAFRDSAVRNLVVVKKEAGENRRRRNLQMIKMKAAVGRVLESAHQSTSHPPKDPPRAGFGVSMVLGLDDAISLSVFVQVIKYKRAEVEKFQDRASTLVTTMRVQDLSLIPGRFTSVISLGERLSSDLMAKERLLQDLIQHRAQLHIIMAHFTYAGHNVTNDFENRRDQYLVAIRGTSSDILELEQKLNFVGNAIVRIRMGTLRILEQLEKRGRKALHFQPDVEATIKVIGEKVKELVEVNGELKKIVGKEEAARNYGGYVKDPPIPRRLIRVGSAEASEGSEEEDDVNDPKVASRLDMKAKSLRFIHQARLRKGIRGD